MSKGGKERGGALVIESFVFFSFVSKSLKERGQK